MQKIYFFILVVCAFFACKKNNNEEPAPTPVVPDPCQSGLLLFPGKYITNYQGDKDTLYITFLHNNCPTIDSNTYHLKGLRSALYKFRKDTSSTLAFLQEEGDGYSKEYSNQLSHLYHWGKTIDFVWNPDYIVLESSQTFRGMTFFRIK